MPRRQRVTRDPSLPLDRLPPALVGLHDRALAAGIPVSLVDHEGEPSLDIELPGTDGAIKLINAERAAGLEAVQFEDYVQLGHYNALYDRASGTLEAGIVADVGSAHEFFHEFSGIANRSVAASNDPASPLWMLEVSAGERLDRWTVGSPTDAFRKLRWAVDDQVTLKLATATRSTEDEQLAYLERASTALFFEIDIRFERILRLQQSARIRVTGVHRVERDRDPNTLPGPRNWYSAQAARLYLVGRQEDSPVARYLFYYQSIEYFFPTMVESQTLRAVERVLADPRFLRGGRAQASEVVAAVRRTRIATSTEEKQLKSVLEEAVRPDEIREFIAGSYTSDYFSAKPQALAGVQKLSFGQDQPDLIEQVAKRVYTLRCRIVHSKRSLSADDVGPLWPDTDESAAMWPDIDLIEFLAQRVLITVGATS